MRGQRRGDDRATGNGECRREIGPEIGAVFRVQGVLVEWDQRPAPPLHIVVAGNDEDGSGLTTQIGEGATALKLAVARALREIAADHDRVGAEIGQHPLQCFDHRHVGEPAEVHISDVGDLDGHNLASIV